MISIFTLVFVWVFSENSEMKSDSKSQWHKKKKICDRPFRIIYSGTCQEWDTLLNEDHNIISNSESAEQILNSPQLLKPNII